jgi:hypothetical protein
LPHFSSFFYVYFFSFSPCLQAETKIIIFAAYGIVVQKWVIQYSYEYFFTTG